MFSSNTRDFLGLSQSALSRTHIKIRLFVSCPSRVRIPTVVASQRRTAARHPLYLSSHTYPHFSATFVLLHTTVPVDVIACICVFFCLSQNAVFSFISDHGHLKAQFWTPFLKQINDSCSFHDVAARLHDQLCENSFKTHFRGFFLRDILRYSMKNKDHAFPTDQQSHSHCD